MKKKISLACTNCSNRNYSTYKNQLTSPERLTVMKYCKHCKKHVLHKETI
ncbi:50S ribosomal protein L33 [Pseudogracilibacillus auburnensis]|nr:50S ribosomal protein L33 [Pseudogracilibacillus auburnensis]MBO1005165.1 50S ribosomal protein L33 [Pseudogracilibacillus auburnensis]